jgi:hypothetical protein
MANMSQDMAGNDGSVQQQQEFNLNNQALALLRAQNGGFGLDASTITAFLQQQQAGKMDRQGASITSEIKRLQQLHQMNALGASGNGLLLPGGHNAALLQSMMEDQQKSINFRFDNPLAQPMGGINPMLQPAFFQDSRLLTAQNQYNAENMNSLRQGEIPLPSPHSLFHRDGSRRMRGGVIEPFPEKLHRMLIEVEKAGRADVISFVANGRALAIHKPEKFFREIVPHYFRQSRLSSFKRQLNLYGFELINTGPARGGYYHELFLKDHPDSCRRMRRVAVKLSPKQEEDDDDRQEPGDMLSGDDPPKDDDNGAEANTN